MAAFIIAVLAMGPLLADTGCPTGCNNPCYSADSIANSASSIADFYAPNTFISIYGQNLAYVTKAMTQEDIAGGILPTALIGTGVRVLINGVPANIWYVSPTLVNVLVPNYLVAGPAIVQLERQGCAGPPIAITLGETAPSLFQTDAITVLGTHGDYSLITASAPAQPGEEIVLYATGLGATVPAAIPNQVWPAPAVLAAASGFQVLLNGVAIDSKYIDYAGAMPDYAGLYQINVTMPPDAPANPEVRIGTGGVISPPGRVLPVQ
jgi:uncharacterized protein (TIGR03437 family)